MIQNLKVALEFFGLLGSDFEEIDRSRNTKIKLLQGHFHAWTLANSGSKRPIASFGSENIRLRLAISQEEPFRSENLGISEVVWIVSVSIGRAAHISLR